MNVKSAGRHSLTLAGVPLVLGVLLVSPQTLVIARLCAAMVAFLLQRINIDKMLYNGAAYACQAALDATIIHLWLQQPARPQPVDRSPWC